MSGYMCGTQRAALGSEERALAALDALVETAVGPSVTRLAHAREDSTPDRCSFSTRVTPGFSQRGTVVSMLAGPDRRVHLAGDHTDRA